MPVSHVVLLGLMGAGKTTIGRRLAERLGWPLSDSDVWLQTRCGATGRELDERLGTAAVHRLEADHLLGALAHAGPSVVCAAASIVDDPGCRAALGEDGVFAVWLAVAPPVLAHRFASGTHRRTLGPDPEARLADQLAARGARFAEVARLTIEGEGRDPGAIAAEIAAALPSA